jgi:hypothetical protein
MRRKEKFHATSATIARNLIQRSYILCSIKLFNATLNWSKRFKKLNLLTQITLTVKTEAANSVEMSITKYKITWHYSYVQSSPQSLPC